MKKIALLLAPAILVFCSCNQETTNEAITTNQNTESLKQGQAFLKTDEGTGNILQIAIGSKDHTTLVAAVQAAEIENVLANNGPITVFAPNNNAFSALPAGTIDELLKPENKSKLAKIITHHASPGTFTKESLKDGMKMYMATGNYLPISLKGNDVYIGDSKILASVTASNGVVHIVDKVILP